jgi:hypothetical protein
VKCKLAYFYHYQTRSRGFDQPETSLFVIKEEEDSDTEASGSWAAAIPRCENHEVGPRIDVWAEENTMSFAVDGHGAAGSCSKGTRVVPRYGILNRWPQHRTYSQVTAPSREPDTERSFYFVDKIVGRWCQVPG